MQAELRLQKIEGGQMGSEQNPIRLIELEGDGIGSLKGRTPEVKLLPHHVRDLIAALRKRYGLVLEIDTTFDLSAESRLAMSNEELARLYNAEIPVAFWRVGGRAIKYSGETIKEAKVRMWVAEQEASGNLTFVSTEAREEFIKIHSESPNGILRETLKFGAIKRPIDSIPALYEPSEFPANLDIETFSDRDLFVPRESEGISRVISVEAMRAFASRLIDRVVSERKSLEIMTKDTISLLDREFKRIIEEEALRRGLVVLGNRDPREEDGKLVLESVEEGENESSGVSCLKIKRIIIDGTHVKKVEEEQPVPDILIRNSLFDSGLAAIVRGGNGDKIIACLPDQKGMLQGLDGQSDSIESDNHVNIPDREVWRIPVGSGYAEELSRNGDLVEETHTLDAQIISQTAKAALKAAAEKGTKLILVTIGGNNNLADKKLIEIVESSIGVGNFEIQTFAEVTSRIYRAPNSGGSVFLTPNQIGDYLTDYLPQMHFRKLGAAALGAGASVAFSYDDDGEEIAGLFVDQAGGTAPDRIRHKEEHKVNPSAALEDIGLLLSDDPRLPENVRAIGLTLRRQINEVSGNYAAQGTTNFAAFVSDLMETMPLAA